VDDCVDDEALAVAGGRLCPGSSVGLAGIVGLGGVAEGIGRISPVQAEDPSAAAAVSTKARDRR
jgi:hypothetical protein